MHNYNEETNAWSKNKPEIKTSVMQTAVEHFHSWVQANH